LCFTLLIFLNFIILLSLTIAFLHFLADYFFTLFFQCLNSQCCHFCCLIIPSLFTGFGIQIYCFSDFVNDKDYPKYYDIYRLISYHFDIRIFKNLFFCFLIKSFHLLLIVLRIIICSLFLSPFYFSIFKQLPWSSIIANLALLIFILLLRRDNLAKIEILILIMHVFKWR